MRHNQLPPLLASDLAPTQITLDPGLPRQIVCPNCGTWRRLTRGMVTAHRAGETSSRPARLIQDRATTTLVEAPAYRAPRCPGSGQRITINLTPEAWRTALDAHHDRHAAAAQDPAGRTPSRVKPLTTTPTDDSQLAGRDRRRNARARRRQWQHAYAPNGPATQADHARTAPLTTALPHLQGTPLPS